MPDEITGTPAAAPIEPVTAADPAAVTPAPLTMTQAEFDAKVATAVSAAAAAARRDGEQRAARREPVAAAPAKSDGDRIAQLEAKLEAQGKRAVFDRVAMRNGVPETAHEDLFDLYVAKGVTDGDAWVKDLRSRGLLPTAGTSATAPAGAPVTGPATPAPRAVNPGVPTDGIVDITRLSDDEIARLGSKGVVDAFKRTLEASRRASGAPPPPALPRPRNGA